MLSTESFATALLRDPRIGLGPHGETIAVAPSPAAEGALKAFFSRAGPSWTAAVQHGFRSVQQAELPVFEREPQMRVARVPQRENTTVIDYAAEVDATQVSTYFANLFRTIESKWQHRIDKYDLWHGHVLSGLGGTGMFILFHAKEFPSDNQQTSLFDEHGVASKGKFSQEDAAYRYRNILYRAADHTLYRLDAFKGTGGGLRLRQGAAANSTAASDFEPAADASDVYKRLVFPFHLEIFGSMEHDDLAAGVASLTVAEALLGQTRGTINIDWPSGADPVIFYKATESPRHQVVEVEDDYRFRASREV